RPRPETPRATGPSEPARETDDGPDLLEEERIPIRQRCDLLEGDAPPKRFRDREEPLVRRLAELADQSLVRPRERLQAHAVDLKRSYGLQERFLERPSDRHHLPGALHRRPDAAVDGRELVERPAGNLRDDVIEGRPEGGERLARHRVRDLIEAEPNRNLRGASGHRGRRPASPRTRTPSIRGRTPRRGPV